MDSIGIPPRILDGDFAGWLRDAMNAQGMSPRMVGLQAGIDPRCVTRVLYGGREPTIATALALLRLFGPGPSQPPKATAQASDIVVP